MWDKIVGQLPVVSRRKTVALNETNHHAIVARNNKFKEIMIDRSEQIHKLRAELYSTIEHRNRVSAQRDEYAADYDRVVDKLWALNHRNLWQRLVYLFKG